MNNAPTIVRFIRFPASLRLTRKGKQFIGPLKRSGPVILSERHDPIDVTFRITVPGITFATGGQTVTHTEAFAEGEQRDFMLPWQLVAEADARIPNMLLEVDVSYSESTDIHTATVPLKLTYGVSRMRAAAVVGGAVAAVAVATAANRRRKLRNAEVEETEVEVEVPRRRTASKKASSKKKESSLSSRKAGGSSSSKKGSSSSSKKTGSSSSSKKAGSSSASKKANSSSKKASSSSKKAAPSKKASAARRR